MAINEGLGRGLQPSERLVADNEARRGQHESYRQPRDCFGATVPLWMFLIPWRGCHIEGVQNQSRPKQVPGIFQSVREYRSRMADPAGEQLRRR